MTDGVALAEPDLTLTCAARFQSIAESCLDGIDKAMAVFLETEDIDGPHKARVALRRLTTCLDAFAPILRRKLSGDMRDEAKALFRNLGKVRDSDVYVQGKADQPGHDKRLRDNLDLRQKTKVQFRKAKVVTFAPRLLAMVQPGGAIYRTSRHARALADGPEDRIAREVLDQAWEACLDFGPSVTAIPGRDRHEFRKDMKRMRYVSEFFADALPGLAEEPFRSDFRTIQDSLGVLNDYEVALKLEKQRVPKRLPEPQAAALSLSEQLWAGLSRAAPPWREDEV